jgi:hypothetical protein
MQQTIRNLAEQIRTGCVVIDLWGKRWRIIGLKSTNPIKYWATDISNKDETSLLLANISMIESNSN